jgi:hypothetical protein
MTKKHFPGFLQVHRKTVYEKPSSLGSSGFLRPGVSLSGVPGRDLHFSGTPTRGRGRLMDAGAGRKSMHSRGSMGSLSSGSIPGSGLEENRHFERSLAGCSKTLRYKPLI